MLTKNTLSFLTCLLFSPFIFSQNFSVGINGGINVAKQKYDYEESNIFDFDLENKIGYSTEVHFIYRLTNHLAFRSGIGLERMGGRFQFSTTDELGNPTGDLYVKANFDYLQIPLLVEFSGGKKISWFANLGYGFHFLQHTVQKQDSSFPEYFTGPLTSNFEKTDYHFYSGIGTRFKLSEKWSLSLEGKHKLGLSDTQKDISLEVKNKSIAVLAGIIYSFKNKSSNI